MLRGTVLSVASPNFQLDPAAAIFPDQSIEVRTFPQTEFEDAAGVGSLAPGQAVRVRGLLLVKQSGPNAEMVLVAEKVDARP